MVFRSLKKSAKSAIIGRLKGLEYSEVKYKNTDTHHYPKMKEREEDDFTRRN